MKWAQNAVAYPLQSKLDCFSLKRQRTVKKNINDLSLLKKKIINKQLIDMCLPLMCPCEEEGAVGKVMNVVEVTAILFVELEMAGVWWLVAWWFSV